MDNQTTRYYIKLLLVGLVSVLGFVISLALSATHGGVCFPIAGACN